MGFGPGFEPELITLCVLGGLMYENLCTKIFYFFFVVSAYHEVSVFPKKELPFFILFTAGLCSGTATLALLTHQYPEYTAYVARMVH